jgi:hypothetical protein
LRIPLCNIYSSLDLNFCTFPVYCDTHTDWIYDLYLKGNKIESGRKNYSEVIGLLISYNEWKKESNK